MKIVRLLIATGSAVVLIGFTLTQLQATASPNIDHVSAASRTDGVTPTLSIQPDALTFLAEVATPTIQTRTLNLSNVVADSTLTWTVSVSATDPLTPLVSPLTGTNDATITVQIDTAPITTTGTYSRRTRRHRRTDVDARCTVHSSDHGYRRRSDQSHLFADDCGQLCRRTSDYHYANGAGVRQFSQIWQ